MQASCMMAGMQDAKGNLLLAQHMTAGEVYLLRPGTLYSKFLCKFLRIFFGDEGQKAETYRRLVLPD